MSDQAIGLIAGIVHVVLSLVLAVMTTYGSFRIMDRLMRDDDHIRQLKENNAAIGILIGGVLVAAALIVKVATQPAIAAVQVFLYREFAWVGLLKIIAMIGGYVLLAIFLANISIWVAMSFFLRMTRNLDELAELRGNNVAVAITLGVVVAVMGLFISDGLASLMQALVPFPEFRPVEVLGG